MCSAPGPSGPSVPITRKPPGPPPLPIPDLSDSEPESGDTDLNKRRVQFEVNPFCDAVIIQARVLLFLNGYIISRKRA